MIIDQRVYATVYALGAVAWAGGLPMISRAKPGAADFRLKMNQADMYMRLVAIALIAVAFINYADWLWS